LFRSFGFIFSVKINKGVFDQLNTANVQFLKDTMALEAIEKMHGKEIDGEKVHLRLGCKECQVFLKVRADSLEIANLLKKILGDLYETVHVSQTTQNRHRDKVLVHLHFQTSSQAEEFRKEFEQFNKIRDQNKLAGKIEDKFLALEDVRGYDERIQISREFQS
jgi:RNA recognition motif-containing protein